MTKKLTLHITINGQPRMLAASQSEKLSTVLRRASIPGCVEGCGEGRCGSCAVILDGFPVRGCRFYAWQVEGRSIQTMTMAHVFPSPHPLREALAACPASDVAQISPGMAMAVKEHLDANPLSTAVHMGILLGADAARMPGYNTLVSALLRVLTDREHAKRS